MLIACGLVGLAIAINLMGRGRFGVQRPHFTMSFRAWVTRDLYRGDLHALSDAARGHYYKLDIGQIDRLNSRGFLAKGFRSTSRVTMKGRLALLMRSTVAKDKPAPEVT